MFIYRRIFFFNSSVFYFILSVLQNIMNHSIHTNGFNILNLRFIFYVRAQKRVFDHIWNPFNNPNYMMWPIIREYVKHKNYTIVLSNLPIKYAHVHLQTTYIANIVIDNKRTLYFIWKLIKNSCYKYKKQQCIEKCFSNSIVKIYHHKSMLCWMRISGIFFILLTSQLNEKKTVKMCKLFDKNCLQPPKRRKVVLNPL